MKILLDECVTRHLKPHFTGHEVATVSEMGWSGIKNGQLMSLCAEHEVDILFTIDRSLQYQQNLDQYPLAIVVLNSRSSKVEDLLPLLPKFNILLQGIQKHKAYVIDR